MGVILFDRADDDHVWMINFWHWRAIVEAVRRLEVFPNEIVDGLHEQYCNTGLNQQQALELAKSIETKLLPKLSPDERVKLDGAKTTGSDDGTFHIPGSGLETENYSTDLEALKSFVDFCRRSKGFNVN